SDEYTIRIFSILHVKEVLLFIRLSNALFLEVFESGRTSWSNTVNNSVKRIILRIFCTSGFNKTSPETVVRIIRTIIQLFSAVEEEIKAFFNGHLTTFITVPVQTKRLVEHFSFTVRHFTRK